MNGLKKSMVVTLLSATVLCPRLSAAMEVRQFDNMASRDRRDYVIFLVKGAQRVLIDQGRRDLAAKVYQLFHEIHPGDQLSLGEAEFEKNLGTVRVFIAENPDTVLTVQVEAVLILTLNKNGIETSPKFSKGLAEVTSNRAFFQKPK